MQKISRVVAGLAAAALLTGSALGAAPISAAAAGAQEFSSQTPVRDFDTRTLHGMVVGNSTVVLTAAQLHVAVGETAVLNVTVTQPTAKGFLTVYPDQDTTPIASTLNFVAGQTVANLVAVPVGADGKVAFHDSGTGNLQLVVDTVGELGSGTGHDTYTPVDPSRIMDTRYGIGFQGPIGGDTLMDVPVVNHGGVPAGADAVVVNLTTTQTANNGFLKAYSSDLTSLPITSVSNWAKGQTVANLAVVQIGADGKIDLVNESNEAAQFIVDVVGYFTRTDSATKYTANAQPIRVLDTRYGIGTGHAATIGPSGGTILLHLSGANNVPTTGTTAVYLNVTVTDAIGAGYLTLYPWGESEPTESTMNFAAGGTIANATVMRLGTGGTIAVVNHGSTPINVIADLYGYFH